MATSDGQHFARLSALPIITTWRKWHVRASGGNRAVRGRDGTHSPITSKAVFSPPFFRGHSWQANEVWIKKKQSWGINSGEKSRLRFLTRISLGLLWDSHFQIWLNSLEYLLSIRFCGRHSCGSFLTLSGQWSREVAGSRTDEWYQAQRNEVTCSRSHS